MSRCQMQGVTQTVERCGVFLLLCGGALVTLRVDLLLIYVGRCSCNSLQCVFPCNCSGPCFQARRIMRWVEFHLVALLWMSFRSLEAGSGKVKSSKFVGSSSPSCRGSRTLLNASMRCGDALINLTMLWSFPTGPFRRQCRRSSCCCPIRWKASD